MTGPLPGSSVDPEGIRQLAVAAALLELVAARYGTPEYEPAAREFERNHSTRDVVSGLIVIASYFGQIAAGGCEEYMRVLGAWRVLGEVADAIGPTLLG